LERRPDGDVSDAHAGRHQTGARGNAVYHQVAHGPGRLPSRDATGELVVLPLHPGMELDVREHAFLAGYITSIIPICVSRACATSSLAGKACSWIASVTGNQPGLLLLHGYGDVFERVLRPGKHDLEPGAFLYKDSSVTMNIETQQLTTGFFGGYGMNLARMTGPGRVGFNPCTCITTRTNGVRRPVPRVFVAL
jgi:uncharacterized protein (AIM24 family)